MPGARILHAQNVRDLSEGRARHALVFAPGGVLRVSRGHTGTYGYAGVSWPITETEIVIGNMKLDSGGGFIGGGFGLEGAAIGMVVADVLNAVTAKRTDLALVTLAREHTSGAEQIVTLGYDQIDEIALREDITAIYPEWAEDWRASTMQSLAQREFDDPAAVQAAASTAWRMHERDLLTSESRDAMLALIDERSPNIPMPTQPITETLTANGVPTLVDQLAQLAELHDAGALTAEEFTAAKARLLA